MSGGLKLHRFHTGALAWDGDWAKSFKIGLTHAKNLWRTQFSRLDNSVRMLEVKNKCMRVDLSFANWIVTKVYDNESYILEGLSATAYWLQVALGLLLPGAAVPDGVATGVVEDHDGELVLRYVEDIPAKLVYATGAGLIGRMVLPADKETRDAIEAYVSDAESQVSLLERNLCSTARAAADAMQPRGWRRANFLATPEVRYGFSSMLQRLFDLQKASGKIVASKDQDTLDDDRLSEADGTAGKSKQSRSLTPRDVEKLNYVRRWLVSDKPEQRIKLVPRSELDEVLLGKTLAWMDEGVRSGSRPPASRANANGDIVDPYSAPGLGVLCVRTRDGEPDMRFWANVFHMLDVNPRLWREFQWANLEQAAVILANVLNNFGADPTVSAAPPPDLLVILDDAGLTQRALTRLFPERFDGKLLQLLNPLRAHVEHHLTQRLRAMPHRQDWLYETRIVVIWPDGELAKKSYADDAVPPPTENATAEHGIAPVADDNLMDFDRMRIFRYGFSIHSAYAVLNHGKRTALKWMAVREQMKAWQAEGKLRYHRAEYYIQERLRLDDSNFRPPDIG